MPESPEKSEFETEVTQALKKIEHDLKNIKAFLDEKASQPSQEELYESLAEAALPIIKETTINIIDILNEIEFNIQKIKDPNLREFYRLKSDANWFKEHLGYYVAFVDGKLIGKSKNRKEFLESLYKAYPNKPKFFKLVEEIEEVIEL